LLDLPEARSALVLCRRCKVQSLSGDADLTDYQFNKKVIHHLFCRNCGLSSFVKGRGSDGSEMVGINVRCLDDADLGELTPTPFDGKSL
jgi:hypothetical protein